MLSLAAVGSQIAIRRKAIHWTQSDLAQKAGVSRATVDALENGRWGELGFSKVNNILTALGLELRVHDANPGRPTLEELLADRAEEDRARDDRAETRRGGERSR